MDIQYNVLNILFAHSNLPQQLLSDNAKFPLLVMKVITRLSVGYLVPMNVEKVIFVEKQFALQVFGIGYGCQALKAPLLPGICGGGFGLGR